MLPPDTGPHPNTNIKNLLDLSFSIFYDDTAAVSFSVLAEAAVSDPDLGALAGADVASSAAGVEKGFPFLLIGDAAFVPWNIWLQVLHLFLC